MPSGKSEKLRPSEDPPKANFMGSIWVPVERVCDSCPDTNSIVGLSGLLARTTLLVVSHWLLKNFKSKEYKLISLDIGLPTILISPSDLIIFIPSGISPE